MIVYLVEFEQAGYFWKLHSTHATPLFTADIECAAQYKTKRGAEELVEHIVGSVKPYVRSRIVTAYTNVEVARAEEWRDIIAERQAAHEAKRNEPRDTIKLSDLV